MSIQRKDKLYFIRQQASKVKKKPGQIGFRGIRGAVPAVIGSVR